MKNNKGITLVSLIGYIILSIMVIAALIVITTNFRKNFGELDVQTVQDIELDKINMQISKEIRDGKEINKSDSTPTKLVFTNGNTYTYVSEDKTLYMNDDVAISKNLKNCSFDLSNEDILRITVQLEDKTRKMDFSLERTHVARIGEKYYKTLQSAINAVPTNNKETIIIILTDISENTTIGDKQNIVLDIGLYTIDNKEDNPVITIGTLGKLKIKNGRITGETGLKPLIENKGTLNIIGGEVKSETSNVLENKGIMNISGTAKIDGTIYNDSNGKILATGGIIKGIKPGNTIENHGSLEVSGNTEVVGSDNDNDNTIYNYEGGKVEMTGGNVTSSKGKALYNEKRRSCNNDERKSNFYKFICYI